MPIARIVPCLAFVLAMAGTVAARGGEELEENAGRAAATPVAERALEHFDAGRYAEAIVDFERAEALFHAPPHLWFLGQAHEKLGHLLEARQLYQQLSDERLAADAPKAFQKAQNDALWALSRLTRRIPSVRVDVRGVDREQVTLTIDGKTRERWWQQPILLDPGEHQLAASAPGVATASKSLTLNEGEHAQTELMLGSEASGDDMEPTEPAKGSIVPAIVALSLGGAGLVVGATTGYLSLSKVDELEDLCPTKRCPPEYQSLGDEAVLLGNVSTVGFVVGGVGVAVGILLLAWRPGGGSESGDTALWVRPRVGPGSLVLEGAF